MDYTKQFGSIIGVDLGGTKLSAVLFDAQMHEQARNKIPVAHLSQSDLIDSLVQMVQELASAASEQVVAVGYGVPTTIDQRTGIAVQAANLPISNLPMQELLQKETNLPSFIDNDANVAALAEQRMGVGKDRTDDLLMITLGTGFGGGIVSDGMIMRGAIGAAAELGHMTINFEGRPCIAPNCPGIGCIETYVSGSALARDLQEFIIANPTSRLAAAVEEGAPAKGETVTKLAREADSDALELIERMGEKLGVGLASLVNIFNPGVIAVGGGLSSILDLLLPPARAVMKQRSLAPGNTFVEVVPATLGEDAGVVGAALMAQAALTSFSGQEKK